MADLVPPCAVPQTKQRNPELGPTIGIELMLAKAWVVHPCLDLVPFERLALLSVPVFNFELDPVRRIALHPKLAHGLSEQDTHAGDPLVPSLVAEVPLTQSIAHPLYVLTSD